MKVKFIIISCCFCVMGFSQNQNPTLANFSVQDFSNSVSISWTVKAGFSCTDLDVEHSTDSINFTSIYNYPGVCGATSEDEDYAFVQENPAKNSKNYYRMNLGNYGYSEVKSVFLFNYSNAGYSITPNPITDGGKLRFSNTENTSCFFEVYDVKGNMIYFLNDITGDEIELGSANLNSGVYFFRLYNAKNSFNGRFSVL